MSQSAKRPKKKVPYPEEAPSDDSTVCIKYLIVIASVFFFVSKTFYLKHKMHMCYVKHKLMGFPI